MVARFNLVQTKNFFYIRIGAQKTITINMDTYVLWMYSIVLLFNLSLQ